jgi:hypothetical protein
MVGEGMVYLLFKTLHMAPPLLLDVYREFGMDAKLHTQK